MENSKRRSLNTRNNRIESDESNQYSTDISKAGSGQNNDSYNFMKGTTSSVYTVDMQNKSFQTPFTPDVVSELPSSDQSGGGRSIKSSRQSRGNDIQLIPFKVKDVMEMIKDNPEYKYKSPVMIEMKENDIDQLMGKQNKKIRETEKLPEEYITQSHRESPMSLRRSLNDQSAIMEQSVGDGSGRVTKKSYKGSKESSPKPINKEESLFGGVNRNENVFAMTDVQAYPMTMERNKIYRRDRGRSRSRRGRHVSPTPRRSVSKLKRRPRSRSRRHRPARQASRPRRVIRRPPPYRRRISPPCTAFPLCENQCCTGAFPPLRRRRRPRPVYTNPSRYGVYYPDDRQYNRPIHAGQQGYIATRPRSRSGPRVVRSRVLPPTHDMSLVCSCNVCENKLQFIQPGVCSKKKNMWTNEYAIIPKPQVNLIDPCEELDPTIYPRADNPCIRDGRGNPLTDCIGRPLRNPVGKNFLKFTANGSVLDTSFNGTFWTGQPPLCVKCPMPSCSCAPDTTHNWWMSCGYPITPDMSPFFKRVVAAETSLLK